MHVSSHITILTLKDILQDPNQKLFTSCTYTNQNGTVCNYPILVGQNPPYCNAHAESVGGSKDQKIVRKRKTISTEPDEKPSLEESLLKKRLKESLANKLNPSPSPTATKPPEPLQFKQLTPPPLKPTGT